MASPKMFAEVVIAGSYKNLAKTTRGATKELTGFEKTAKKISGAISAAFAGIAIAGLTSVWDGLMDMTKAAAADNKSMALLNKTITNNWKVTDKTTKKMDDYLNSVSNMTGILDDDLRPAFGKIVRVTKGSTKAMKAFDMVMNISAGTGKDANTVAAAYAKYLAGNNNALNRLVPGIQNATNKTKFLNEQFQGMAAIGGANDPFAKINAVMDNFKEKLGMAFLPLVNSFADWLAGPDAQGMMDSIAKWVQDTMGWFTSPEGKKTLNDWYEKAKELARVMWEIVQAIASMLGVTPMGMKKNENTSKAENFAAGISGRSNQYVSNTASKQDYIPTYLKDVGMNTGVKPGVYTGNASDTRQVPTVVNIYGAVSGNDVVKALKSTAQSRGVTLGKLLQ